MTHLALEGAMAAIAQSVQSADKNLRAAQQELEQLLHARHLDESEMESLALWITQAEEQAEASLAMLHALNSANRACPAASHGNGPRWRPRRAGLAARADAGASPRT